jgi:hypothetical protein
VKVQKFKPIQKKCLLKSLKKKNKNSSEVILKKFLMIVVATKSHKIQGCYLRPHLICNIWFAALLGKFGVSVYLLVIFQELLEFSPFCYGPSKWETLSLWWSKDLI